MVNPSSEPINSQNNEDSSYRELNVRLMCMDCRNPVPNIIEEFAQGDLVCGDCGVVFRGGIIDTRSEWRTFASDDSADPSRVGAAANSLLDGGSQLDTSIQLSGGSTELAKTLNKVMNATNNTKSARNKNQAYRDIAELCEAGDLPRSVAETAKHAYNMIDKLTSLKIPVRSALLAACIFFACREEGVPRTFREISNKTQVPKEDIGKCFKTIQVHLRSVKKAKATGAELMGRFCSVLNLPMEVQTAAADLAVKSREVTAIASRSPLTVAAGAIYFICHLFNMPKTIQEVAEISGVSTSTVRVTYRALYAEKSSLIDINSYRTKVSFANLPPV